MSGDVQRLPTADRLVGGRYELEALIGKGGVGEVWRAKHVALNSPVAIKFLQGASAQKDTVRRRFTTEAQVTAQLKTPNAVQVFDFGVTEEGHPYLVMELLEGETLGQRLERLKRLPPAEAVRLLGQCARALQRAHQLGIVHRDFKPDNVVICVDDQGQEQVKVLDFGVAKLVGALEDSGEHEASPPSDAGRDSSTFSTFTRTGAVLGTPLYMAPEQVKDAADVDLRSDIWAFGVVAYECLTGRAPFTAESIEELFRRILAGNHPRADFVEETLPPAFDVWFNVACAPDRDNRYASAVIAFRQLATSLGVTVTDDSGRSDGLSTSGERRVLVVPDSSSSERVSGPGSIRRIALRTTDRPPPPPTPSLPLAASTTNDGQARTSARGWLVGIVGACVLGALAIWTGSTRRDPPASMSTATAAPPAALPGPTASASIAVEAPPAPPTASAPPSAAPTAPSKRAPARPGVSGAPAVATSPAATAAALRPIASATSVPVQPPPPALPPPAAVPDPGSYR